MVPKSPPNVIPRHVAIIMDGNRRWARQHKLAALKGHEYVADAVIQPLVERCIALGIPYLTLWALSTENWQRDEAEVAGLMELFRRAFTRGTEKLHKQGVKLGAIGDLRRLPADIRQDIAARIDETKANEKITVTFALNYGGRDELVRAVNKILDSGQHDPITEEDIARSLDTAGLPDPDLLIRPGGERRLSGFLPWQSIYSELYFTDVLMPDFSPAELDKALADYAQRQRRFGQ